MELTVRKWGNSLGIRLPHTIANSLKIKDGTSVDINIIDDTISIKKSSEGFNLQEMLKKISSENLHEENDFGPSLGKEE